MAKRRKEIRRKIVDEMTEMLCTRCPGNVKRKACQGVVIRYKVNELWWYARRFGAKRALD